MKVFFTEITRHGGPLSKTIRPDGKGGIVKKPAASMTRGTARTVTIPFEGFGPYLRTLKPNQAIVHGVCDHAEIKIVSRAKFTGQEGTITRSKEFFHYPTGPGIGMFDHDPKPGQKALSPDELLKIICQVAPSFRNALTWSTPSTSSCIYDMNGHQLTDEGNGFHLYFSVLDASDLPRFADVLFARLWLAGHGYIFISKAGSMLERTVFDKTVFSPERLDFVSGANCIKCEQRLPDPVLRRGVSEVAA